jgi:hypothetical protein
MAFGLAPLTAFAKATLCGGTNFAKAKAEAHPKILGYRLQIRSRHFGGNIVNKGKSFSLSSLMHHHLHYPSPICYVLKAYLHKHPLCIRRTCARCAINGNLPCLASQLIYTKL